MLKNDIESRLEKWVKKLRLHPQWDVTLECVEDPLWPKTGDFKIDVDDKKAVLMLNVHNPKHENLEEVIVHELMHLKLWPLDQVTNGLIDAHYEKGTSAYDFAYGQFMTTLEQTVEELTKCFLLEFGENRAISYGRAKQMKGLNTLFDKMFNQTEEE